MTQTSPQKSHLPLIGIALAGALLSLIPPSIIGLGSSALTLQSLEHLMSSTPDSFEALHIHWLWVPRLIAYVTGDAFSALVIFRMIVVGLTVYLFEKTCIRFFDDRRAMFGCAMLALNATVLSVTHTFALPLLSMLAAVSILYLFTSENPNNHKIAALLLGLTLSVGFWPFVLMLAVFTVGLNIHHATYTARSRQTYVLFGLILVGAASWLLLEILYFGAAHLWQAINPTFFKPRGVSLIAQGAIIAIVSANLLFVAFRPKPGIGSEFHSALLVLVIFFALNLFGREEMLHDAMIFVPCTIIVALDRIPWITRFAPVYLAVNLGLFFLLPSFVNDPELPLASRRRAKSDDVTAFAYYRTFDIFSHAQLREEKRGEEEARELLASEHLDSTMVLINSSTDTWFDAGTLGALFPHGHFAWYYGYPTDVARINGLKDTSFLKPTAANPYGAGLFSKEFARTYLDSMLPPNTPIHETERLQFIDTRSNDQLRVALINRLIYLQHQSFH